MFNFLRNARIFFLIGLVGLIITAGWQTFAQANAAASISLDGLRDAAYGDPIAADPAGDLASPGPADWSGTLWSDLTALYCQRDADYLYVYADLPAYAQAVSAGQMGLLLNTAVGGGSTDPWGNAITFEHSDRPNFVVRGDIPGIEGSNGWTELRVWNGASWSTGGTNWGGISDGGQIGTNIAYANNAGLELRVPFADLGVSHEAEIGLQLFTTQGGSTKGAYDTVPSDNQATGWDTPTSLSQYALCAPPAAPPTPTSEAPTATAETATAVPTVTPPTNSVVRMAEYSVAPGEQVTTAVTAVDFPTSGLGALNIAVAYDPAVIAIEGCAVDPEGQMSAGLCNIAYAPDVIRFNGAAVSGTTANPLTLAHLTFTAVGLIGDSSPLNLTVNLLTNPDGEGLLFTITQGRIVITDPLEPTPTPTFTATPTAIPTFTATPTATPTFTATPTATPTFTATPTATPTFTATPTATPTFTATPTATPTSEPTAQSPLTPGATLYLPLIIR
jgi:hypothetical protein